VWCVSLAAGGSSEAAVLALQDQLHEKELRLTDVQLEALSSAHQLQQLQDTINRMKVRRCTRPSDGSVEQELAVL